LRRNKVHDSQELGICMRDGGNGEIGWLICLFIVK
jgi:hypothetical protein